MNWQTWLQSEPCHQALLLAAARVYLLCRRYAVPKSLLPCAEISELALQARRECLSELANELWLFASSQADAWDKRHGFPVCADQDPRPAAFQVANRFVLHLRDRARTKDVDPRKALYRRLRQILQQQPDMGYRTTENGAFYSLQLDLKEDPNQLQAAAEPYGQWDPPAASTAMRELQKKPQLLAIARDFWQQAQVRLGEPRWLPVRELVRYIAAHFPLDDIPRMVSLDEPGKGGSGAIRQEPMEIADIVNLDHQLVACRLTELARHALTGWTQKEIKVFYLTQGEEGGSLAAAAGELGYSGPSGVSYVLNGLLTRLRDFCLLWPGLSPPDLDETLVATFIDEVLNICKSTIESR